MAATSTESNEIPDKEDLIEEKSKPMDATNYNVIIYIHTIFLTYYHIAGLYGLYLGLTSVKWATIAFGLLLHMLGTLGVTAGAHRLWSHRSYKAKTPLQILLMVFNCIAFQKTATTWVKDHRLHHKFSDTDGDPHNANRGFFFSHIGWLITKKTDEVVAGHKILDISDINNNPVLRFQKKYIIPLVLTLCFGLPTIIPMYFWGETLTNAYHFNMFRYIVTLNAVCCVNSVAHMWGYKPYDKNILPAQTPIVSFATLGEGFHNYHHVFPFDYKTSELGNRNLNYTTWFIDFFAWIGWAYDLKSVSEEIVKKRAQRTGDSTDLWGRTDKTD